MQTDIKWQTRIPAPVKEADEEGRGQRWQSTKQKQVESMEAGRQHSQHGPSRQKPNKSHSQQLPAEGIRASPVAAALQALLQSIGASLLWVSGFSSVSGAPGPSDLRLSSQFSPLEITLPSVLPLRRQQHRSVNPDKLCQLCQRGTEWQPCTLLVPGLFANHPYRQVGHRSTQHILSQKALPLLLEGQL